MDRRDGRHFGRPTRKGIREGGGSILRSHKRESSPSRGKRKDTAISRDEQGESGLQIRDVTVHPSRDVSFPSVGSRIGGKTKIERGGHPIYPLLAGGRIRFSHRGKKKKAQGLLSLNSTLTPKQVTFPQYHLYLGRGSRMGEKRRGRIEP